MYRIPIDGVIYEILDTLDHDDVHGYNDSLRGEDYHLPDLLRTWWGLSSDVLLTEEIMSHTPTPWHINKDWLASMPRDHEDEEHEDYEFDEDGDIRGANNELIADMFLQEGDDQYQSDIAVANARFIVKAVNNYYRLLKENQSLKDQLKRKKNER